jgi:tetratricopeptide (TPR) repeat protein
MYNYSEATAELKTAIDAFPDNINLYYHLIRVMQLDREYDAVIKVCNEGLTVSPGDENIIASIAEAYKNKENYPEARKYYRMLTQTYGKEKYFLDEARILIAEGKYDEAFEIYNYIQQSGTATAALYSEIAEAHITQGDYNSAMEQLNTGLKNDEDNAHLHYLTGVVYSKQGNSQSALTSFEKAVELDDSKEDHFISLADEYLAGGDIDNATFNFESALLLNPNNLDVLVKLGNLYLEQEKFDYSYRLLSKASSLSPGAMDIQAAFNLAGEKRGTANATREPIEFNFIELGELTPALLEYYSRNPFGSVTIFNTRNDSFTDIIIEISCPDLFSAPALVSIPALRPNEFVEKLFSLNFNNELYNKIPRSKEEVSISFTVKYNLDGQQKILTQNEKIVLFW